MSFLRTLIPFDMARRLTVTGRYFGKVSLLGQPQESPHPD